MPLKESSNTKFGPFSSNKAPKALELTTPIQYLKGVGPKLAEVFAQKGIRTIEDFLMIFPRAYEDQRSVCTISGLVEDQVCVLNVELVRVHQRRLRGGRRMLEWVCCDVTGSISCVFFHFTSGYHLAIRSGSRLTLIGKPVLRAGKWQLVHPQFRVVAQEDIGAPVEATIVPIYPEPQPLSQKKWRQLVHEALSRIHFPESDMDHLLQQRCDSPPREKAARVLHQPSIDLNIAELQSGLSPQHMRFVIEEFLLYELGLQLRYRKRHAQATVQLSQHSPRWDKLKERLPFHLTQDQETVIEEITSIMSRGERAYSLIQGDVGSGKTLVAMALALHAVDSGAQVFLMAPTEILAEQHFHQFRERLKGLDVEVDLLTGGVSAKQRKVVLQNLAMNVTQILIGTHALIQDGVEASRLGLIIIDEQHRFGVQQRLKLSQKGVLPHQVHMTATPIPRTLALTLFGDMDVHFIRQKPAGRKPIRTKWVSGSRREGVYQFLAQECVKGRQAYVVFPLIEESETLDLKNATEEYEKLCVRFPELKMRLLHGRVPSVEREAIMRAFVRGETQVLVSTTVIEVGVDVPNATVMIIENFGLSQLHQLRGRVGRGEFESWCVLVAGHAVTAEGQNRLAVMEESDDGFFIAEKDLEMRGPGEFIGEKQSGLPLFKHADLIKHARAHDQARTLAKELMGSENADELIQLEIKVKNYFGEKLDLLNA